MSEQKEVKRITTNTIQEMKQKGEKIAMLTSYDYSMASIVDEGGVDEVISTRRLTHITKTFGVFKDRLKAVELCLNRFDDETKTTFLDLYTKIDPSVLPEEAVPEVQTNPFVSAPDVSEIPF